MAIGAASGTLVQSAQWQAGHEYTVLGYYTIGAAIAAADTITWTDALPPLVNAIKPIQFVLWGAELDTNASPTATVIVGDGTDTDAYLASKTAGDANGQMQFFGDGALFSSAVGTVAGRNIVLTIGGTVATAAATGTVWIALRYNCVNTNG